MPLFSTIKLATSQLLSQTEGRYEQGASLKDKLIQCYSHQVAAALCTLFSNDEASHNEPLLHESLERLLEANWDLVKGTTLSYTALPTHPVTQLLCDTASYLAQQKALSTPPIAIPALSILVPGIGLESAKEGYPDFNGTENLAEVLQTHILDQSQTVLLPLQILTELELSPAPQRLDNPYYNVFQTPLIMSDVVCAEELERLSQHSNLTRDMIHAKKAYELLAHDKSTLLGHLIELCRHLLLNGAHGGLGAEDNAGNGAYAAILNFNCYYQTLGGEQSNIPTKLKLEIEKLLDLSSNPLANTNATQNLDTCIANRRAALIEEMQGLEERLSQIGLMSGDAKAGLLTAARDNFMAAKQALKDKLMTHSYSVGHDSPSLTNALLRQFDFKVSFESLRDLDILKSLRPEEISSIMADDALQRQFIAQIANIENLVIFAIESAPDKLSAFIKTMADLLVRTNMIEQPNDLAALLISLDPERCDIICEAFKAYLPQIILTYDDLNALKIHLRPEQQTPLLKHIKRQTDWYFHISHRKFEGILKIIQRMEEVIKVGTKPLMSTNGLYDLIFSLLKKIELNDKNKSILEEILAYIQYKLHNYPSRIAELSDVIDHIKNLNSPTPDLDQLSDAIDKTIFSVNQTNCNNVSILMIAAINRRFELVERLLRGGANWNIRCTINEVDQKPLLHCLASTDLFKKLPSILKDGDHLYAIADAFHFNGLYGTLLQHAAYYPETYKAILTWLPEDNKQYIQAYNFAATTAHDPIDPDFLKWLLRHLPAFIQNENDFIFYITCFEYSNRKDYDLIRTPDDLIRLKPGNDLGALPKTYLKKALIDYVKSLQPITNLFSQLLATLPLEDQAIFKPLLLGHRLKQITCVMGSIHHLHAFLFRELSKAERNIVIHEFKADVIAHLISIQDILYLIEYLDKEQRTVLLPNLFDSFVYIDLDLDKTFNDLERIEGYFKMHQSASNPYFRLFNQLRMLYEQKVTDDDHHLNTYVYRALGQVIQINRLGDFDALQQEFSDMLELANSYEIQAIKQYIQILKEKTTCGSGFFKKSPWAKAHDIERALCSMPIFSRGTVLSQESNLVKTAISASRTPGRTNAYGLVKVQRLLEELRTGNAFPAPR